MTWRTVVIQNRCKLSYKNGYMLIRNQDFKMMHLSEINTLIIDSTAVSITSYLLAELLQRKVKVIFCDEKRNPLGEVIPYYGSHDSSKKIHKQLEWDKDYTRMVWTEIIIEKIENQALLLKYYGFDTYQLLIKYLEEIELFDATNREGHAAKVYFNSMFGLNFNREDINDINAMLNYGYAILLSQFNKEIVANGYLTQLGIKHSNYFNKFNLSCDLMEPFRPLVDMIVKENYGKVFDGTMKLELLNVLNKKVKIKQRSQFVSNAIGIYVKSVFQAIEKRDLSMLEFFEYEL